MEKPKINPPLRRLDQLFEALSILCVIYMVAQLIFEYPGLTETVPTHFGASGSPDAWGNKTSLLILPLVGIIMYAGLTVLNFYPYIFNFPVQITEKNAEKQYQLAKSLISTLKFMVIVLFLYIQIQTINVAKELQPGLGVNFLIIALIGTFLPIIIYFILSLKNK